MGGYGKPFNTKFRDFGVPLVMLWQMWGTWNWGLPVSIVLLFGAMTTYWTPKKQADVAWWNWALTGFGYSIAWLPFCWINASLPGLLWYTIIVTIATAVWSELVSWDDAEEFGRGAIVVLAAPLLLWR